MAAVCTGAVFGGLAVVFSDLSESLGCLLGGFCLSMWLLTLRPGGLVSHANAKAVFISAFTCGAFGLHFCRWTRTYGLITCISFSGSTAVILGVDCFSRAGLREFWAYIWALNDKLFPPETVTYPLTRGIRVELAFTALMSAFGVASQLKLCPVIKSRRNTLGKSLPGRYPGLPSDEEVVGRRIRDKNSHESHEWEAAHGNNRFRLSVELPSNLKLPTLLAGKPARAQGMKSEDAASVRIVGSMPEKVAESNTYERVAGRYGSRERPSTLAKDDSPHASDLQVTRRVSVGEVDESSVAAVIDNEETLGQLTTWRARSEMHSVGAMWDGTGSRMNGEISEPDWLSQVLQAGARASPEPLEVTEAAETMGQRKTNSLGTTDGSVEFVAEAVAIGKPTVAPSAAPGAPYQATLSKPRPSDPVASFSQVKRPREVVAGSRDASSLDDDRSASHRGLASTALLQAPPAHLTAVNLPAALPQVALTHRMREWAKHLSAADAPDSEISYDDIERLSDAPSEEPAPLDIMELQPPAENAAPIPAPSQRSRARWKKGSRVQSGDAAPSSHSRDASSAITLDSSTQSTPGITPHPSHQTLLGMRELLLRTRASGIRARLSGDTIHIAAEPTTPTTSPCDTSYSCLPACAAPTDQNAAADAAVALLLLRHHRTFPPEPAETAATAARQARLAHFRRSVAADLRARKTSPAFVLPAARPPSQRSVHANRRVATRAPGQGRGMTERSMGVEGRAAFRQESTDLQRGVLLAQLRGTELEARGVRRRARDGSLARAHRAAMRRLQGSVKVD